MANFLKDIEEALKGEAVEGIVVGRHGDVWSMEESRPESYPLQSWQEARVHLDYEYDEGFGGADCHAIYLWTSTRVLFVAEYDGATSIASIPRHPQQAYPRMSGEIDLT